MTIIAYDKKPVFNERLIRVFGWELWQVGRRTDVISYSENIYEYELGIYLWKNGEFRGWIIPPCWVR